MTDIQSSSDAVIASPKPRRKRFQFSLRTLMIVVLAYGGLWLLTIKWGGTTLARGYAKYNKVSEPKFGDTGISLLLPVYKYSSIAHNAFGEIDHFEYSRGKVISPGPFILLWRWESKNNVDGDYKQIEGVGGSYLWFFGFVWPLGIRNNPTLYDPNWIEL